ncbi:succinylglutamate-semialdehyde dehydrogenase [Sphingomonas lacunae]|uniref:Succinylglutamate-semialdehyde dehydrogenase n=1 Tax=Sphingomonas lacunae TaxID=2698828 RepID=A0A6M4ARE0_9SPHN|nr:succinylglutamate-semialdehyde dehydrogenase [Sphingomonas lacunae]QJQ31583.1 succinylglutamate-semialdehyde dehydrogenase [Sphingomonas lacunae]
MSSELISVEPATGAELWRGTHGDVDAEVAAAREAWPEWAALAFAKRVDLLKRFAERLKANGEPLAELIARETGKPLWEARTEVESVANKVDISMKSYAERTAQRRSEGAMGSRTAVRHKPHGVLAVLGPYNFPAHLPNGHMIPALLAGNAVVFKPSEKTPAVGEMLINLYREAGIPEGVVRIVQGGPEEGKALVVHRDIDGVLFTGSARAGIAINRALAARPDRIVALEMGGNNPIVAWDTADMTNAATLIVQSAFLSAGQRCSNARRLIVKEELAQPLLEAVRKLTDRLIVGAPHDEPQPYMGPVIDNDTADGLMESFLYLISNGGTAIRFMTRPDERLPFLTPGIVDITNIAERPDVELFGPLLQVVRVPDFDAAIAEANATAYGLSASLIGGNAKDYDTFWANVRAGVINWNKPTNGAASNQPFGGVGLSGNHRPSAYYAADYCAYPVSSSEADAPRATIGIGLANEY